MSEERLNKLLAQAGIASRRASDRLIEEGRVRLNGRVVRELGTRADPARDAIEVDGRPLPKAPARPTYLLLHKPKGYVTTVSDPEGRPTVMDLLPRDAPRVFPVGRLDWGSEGLLLLTDDGELARDLMHPSRHVEKTYRVKVRGRPDAETLERLRSGIPLDGRRTAPARFRVVQPGPNTWLEAVLTDGRKQQLRRMLQIVGHPVSKLRRVAFGPLVLGKLPAGGCRPLRPAEVEKLRAAVARKPAPRRRRRSS